MLEVPLTVGSTFTGIGAADIGLEWAGYKIAWQCERDDYKQSVLRAHWPGVELYDDIVTLTSPVNVDLMIGGFPCQDLSSAGKRKGFDGQRSVLAFEFLRLADTIRPRWIILENVPGLLTSNKGRDFGRLVAELVACGYGVGWRILDAKYFGVAQRRRRLFLIARRVDGRLDSRDASRLAFRALSEYGEGDSTACLPERYEHLARARSSTQENRRIVFRKSRRAQSNRDHETWVSDGRANTLNRFDTGDARTTHIVIGTGADDYAARRLTPVEWERLTGLPDNWTAPKGINAPERKRYEACGDAIVTTVAYWIGQRINMIEEETR